MSALAAARAAPLLEVAGVVAQYGRILALDGVTLQVQEGALVALIGANGAGKTTLLRTLSGVQPAVSGTIRFGGVDLTRASTQARVRAGLVQVPEGRQVFGPLSVEDNLRLGGYLRPAADRARRLAYAYEMFPALRDKRGAAAETLSGGQQQMLAIGRALMSAPKLLLLDEPGMGLAPQLVDEVFATIERLRSEGVSVLLVGQNAAAAPAIADYGYVLETGRIVLDGTGASLYDNAEVQASYLGM